MLTELIFTGVAVGVLYVLIHLTERVFAQRKHPVEKDVRLIDHRSRM